MKQVSWGVSTFVCLLFVLGCGRDPHARQAISGQVTVAGTALNQGTISFYPSEDSPPAAESLIQQGKYDIPAKQGLVPGKYLVRISSVEEVEMTPEDYAAGKEFPPPRERIPAHYNSQSTHYIDVSGTATNQFDFAVEQSH